MSERTFDDFDAFAKGYRSIHNDNLKLSGADSFYFAEMKVRLLQPSETDQSIRVLDLGCGDGATELFMQQYFPRWAVNGIDVSEQSIREAKNKKLDNAEFRMYDGSVIPFTGESFDIVFVAGVLHHVDFNLHNKIVKEIFRVLKKRGRLYLFEHNPLNPVTRHLVKTCVFDKDAKLLQYKYAVNLLEKNNFRQLDNQFIIFFPRKGWLSKLIFLEKYLQWLPLGGQYFLTARK